MRVQVFSVFFFFSCFRGSAEAPDVPRIVIPHSDPSLKRIHLAGDYPSAQILLERESDKVTVFGHNNLTSVNFRNPQQTPKQGYVLWKDCINSGSSHKGCNYKVTVVHKREKSNLAFVCGTKGDKTLCCDVDLSAQSPECITSERVSSIRGSISDFVIKEGEASALVESETEEDLYITYSGSHMFVGIQKFGRNRVSPANINKEHHYVGLVPIRHPDDPLQDKVYGFYKERNQDRGLHSEMWLPFVTQVCMADIGGPKSRLQFSWTSQMSSRLFCGDLDSRQHFSDLVDVAAVHADLWQNTRVYALFRNEWGVSAVCVYTMNDIHIVFTSSPFKGTGPQEIRPRECVPDSTNIPLAVLKMIEENSEMEEWVRPEDNSEPILVNRYNYTHIYVDSSLNPHPVLFLSLENGRIHKVLHNRNETFIISEYQPFQKDAHLLSMAFHASSRKLYVTSRSELVNIDVASCAQHGDSCEDCVLARDPYCGWKKPNCIAAKPNTLQDVAQGNPDVCRIEVYPHQDFRYNFPDRQSNIWLNSKSKYFLQCPVSSHHAEYTWHHPEGHSPCDSKEQQCLLLIDSMSVKQDGPYKCVSQEKGYSKLVVEHKLRLKNRAPGHSTSLLLWVCLMALLLLK